MARTTLSWHWFVRSFGLWFSVILEKFSECSGATCQRLWIKAQEQGSMPLPAALPCTELAPYLQSQPSTHCAPSKIHNGFIYTSLSFAVSDISFATREGKKERRAHCLSGAASIHWPGIARVVQGEFPNAAISHFTIDPGAVPADAKRIVKSLMSWLDLKNLTPPNSHILWWDSIPCNSLEGNEHGGKKLMWNLQGYLRASETEVELKVSATCASPFTHLPLKV